MSVFNGGRYLREAVESMLAQTFTDFEFIIIDDGSEDDSWKILNEYAAHDSRLVVHRQTNSGLTRALNNGISIARGRYIARMDADDFAEPDRLTLQHEFLEQNSSVVAVGTGIVIVDPYGIPIRTQEVALSHDDIVIKLLRGEGAAICHPSIIIRTESIRKLGGYCEKYREGQDLDLYLRLSEIGKLANLDQPLLYWRQHLSSTNHTKQQRSNNNRIEIVRKAYERRGLTFIEANMGEWSDQPRVYFLWQWGWNALSKGFRKEAFSHALSALKQNPFSIMSYKLLACIIRGH
jgi:glycosyltransferase involved in cell wall biosynthesis